MAKTRYRDILLWGDSKEPHAPQKHIDYFDALFPREGRARSSYNLGETTVQLKKRSKLQTTQIKRLEQIAGKSNVATDDRTRAKHSYGKFYLELLQLRNGSIENPPDGVVSPKTEEILSKVLAYCHEQRIPVVPAGGRTSVTRGLEPTKGGIVLDLTKHLNHILDFNETDQTVTVQPGVWGPQLEKYLNNTEEGYTCGHFPQSFEFSTVGGWVMARGAGQASTGYGKIEDIVLSVRLVTPTGVIETPECPAFSMGPDLKHLIMGSEGILGVATKITLKVRTYRPENQKCQAFMFKDFASATEVMRKTMQGEFGFPHLFRISDGAETDAGFTMERRSGTVLDKFLRLLGYKPGKRCLLYAATEGDKGRVKLVARKLARLARHHEALPLGAHPTKKWLEQRYSSAYIRDPVMDHGLRLDTLETSTTWEKLLDLWEAVRDYIVEQHNHTCLVHISHAYENGANLYFVFAAPMAEDEYQDFANFHKGLVETIVKNGGSLSHHHGIGRLLKPYMSDAWGAAGVEWLKAIKKKVDPRGIMNPGALI